MTSFAKAVSTQRTTTTNGMAAQVSTGNACVDFFFKVGASRGTNVIPMFVAALVEDRELALRITLWARDVRSGAGERKIFRDILQYLESVGDQDAVVRLMYKTPELGRWDDLLHFNSNWAKNEAYNLIAVALSKGNGLCAKWMPRKGNTAVELRKYIECSPRDYRKLVVGLTNVVETKMCNKDWDNINFSQVPSLASARYRSAFFRNTPKYKEYVDALVKKTDPTVKVNTGAVYPHDVLKSLIGYEGIKYTNSTELQFITAQWDALPNFIGDANVLPMIDTSGSMYTPAGGKSTVTCMDVAFSLGMYCADKNTGKFKDVFLTFSAHPELCTISGNIVQKLTQVSNSHWEMNTNLVRALNKVLDTAISGGVPESEMPSTLLILSDMQFDACVDVEASALQIIRTKYYNAGYEMPKIVFWNIKAYDNVPVSENEIGVALVSGYSPTILKSVLSGSMEEFTPKSIMLKTVMDERYKF